MKYYEYNTNGFLIGWHEDSGRIRSTTIEPVGIEPDKAKWNGSAWVADSSQRDTRNTNKQSKDNSDSNDNSLLETINPTTASNNEIIDAMRALLRLRKG